MWGKIDLQSGIQGISFSTMTMNQLTLLCVHEFLAKNNMTVIPHPPYSPDFMLCNFFLFPKLRIALKGRRFDDIPMIQAKS
jgi:hypothetical protein